MIHLTHFLFIDMSHKVCVNKKLTVWVEMVKLIDFFVDKESLFIHKEVKRDRFRISQMHDSLCWPPNGPFGNIKWSFHSLYMGVRRPYVQLGIGCGTIIWFLFWKDILKANKHRFASVKSERDSIWPLHEWTDSLYPRK